MSFVHFLRNLYISTPIQKIVIYCFSLPFFNGKGNRVTVPLRNQLLVAVTSNDFGTIKISVTSNCNGTVTRKNG